MPSLTPDEILEIHKNYADQFASLAQSGLSAAFGALSSSGIFDYHPTGISIRMPDFGVPNPVGTLPDLPDDPKLPKLGTLTNFVPIPNISGGAAAGPPVSGLGNPPVYNPPSKPGSVRDFGVVAPASPATPTMPAVPNYMPLPSTTLPYPTVTIPTAPVITDPIFDGVRPDEIVIPDPAVIVAQYNAELNAHRTFLPAFMQGNADAFIARYCPEFNTLRSRINNAITSYVDPVTGGGIGLPAIIEGAIYARSNDRNNMEFQKAVETVEDAMARKGFTMPPGAVNDAIRQARINMGDANVRSSTDIATKNVEMEQANFQFMLKLGEALEEKMLETVTQYLRLSLEIDAQSIASAKEIVATYISAYNLQVLVYRALWEGYTADVAALRARIEANMQRVNLYEAQIKGELAKTEVNKATVDVLRAIADVNLATANAYKAQIDAALAPLEVARLQIAIFEAQARAYAAEVGAYEARWRGYVAETEGELAQFKAYDSQAQAFIAQVQGFKAQVEAFSAQVGAAAETNRAVGVHNESQVKVYTAQADSAIKVYDGQVAAYTAQSNVVVKTAEIEVEYWRTKANLIFQEFNVAVNQSFEYAREQMNLFRGQMEAAINAANGLAHASQVAGNLAGGAMQGLTSFAGILESKEG
jgi:hypothetical protein